jgi:hypothetical protein
MHLLFLILQFLARSGMTESAFGREVVNDPRFVHDLRRGRLPHDRTIARVEAWIAAWRPAR